MENIQALHGWEKIDSPEGIFAYTHAVEGSDLKSLKVDFYVDKPAAVAAGWLFANYLRVSQAVGKKSVATEELHRYGENAYIFKEVFTPPVGLIQPRCTVMYHMKLATAEGMHALIATSVDGAHPAPEGMTMADCKHLVHVFEPTAEDANRTHVTVSYSSDPSGSIPSTIANKILKKRVNFYNTARQMITDEAS
jgi:hypothetical protein